MGADHSPRSRPFYVLGVDGGTTKTVALVADDQGRIVGAARGGGSNWTGEDVTMPMGVVAGTVREALKQAQLGGNDIRLGVFCLAGADWPEDHTRRAAVLEQAGICRKVIVKNDSFGGLRAGTSAPYGMVIAAGTGFNAAVIAPDRREWAFGYYETFGGARTIVQDAFEAVLRAEDGRGQPTLLTSLVLHQLDFATVEAMLRAYVLGAIEHKRLYSICPLVFRAALASDAVAAAILVRQGEGLAEYVVAMANRFDMRQIEFDVVLAGSVFKGEGPLLKDTITQAVHRALPRARIVRARYEPAAGSLLLAYDALGVPITQALTTCMETTLPCKEFFNTAGYTGVQEGASQ